MDDRRGFVFADGSFQQIAIAEIPTHDFDTVDGMRPHQLTLRHPIAHQADHIGAGFHQTAGQPGSHQTGSAGN